MSATPDLRPTTAWDVVLDGLEQDVVALEDALAGGRPADAPSQPWSPPAPAGALPAHLVRRAWSLRRRQQAALAALDDAAAAVRQELAYVASVDDEAHPRSRPAFLDAAL